MTATLTPGQLSILYSLRDGEYPLLRAPDAELLFHERDLAQLSHLRLIERHGTTCALTLLGLDAILLPANARPLSDEHLARYSRHASR